MPPGTLPHLDLVEAYHVSVPFRRPFATAGGFVTTRSSWIVRLRDLDGRDGWGEIALDPGASTSEMDRLALAVREAVEAFAAGRGPDPQVVAASGSTGRAVLAGLDEAREALARVVSGASTSAQVPGSVAVNATLDVTEPRPAAEAAARAVAAGFSCLKLKVTAEAPAALVARLRAVREAAGGSVRIRLDANGSWSVAEAAERLNALAPFEIEYVEQPLASNDFSGHAALRLACSVPIALDESIDSEEAAVAALAAGAADVLVVKPARVGGPAIVRAIAARAAAVGVPVVLSTFFETGIGTDAALRAAAELPLLGRERAHGLATAGLLAHDLLKAPAAVVDGRIAVPAALAVDEGALERFMVERAGAGSGAARRVAR
jgi:o-succinylbenzoate synthase